MDVSSVASQPTRVNLREAVAIQTLRKVLDFQEQENAQLVQLIAQTGSVGSRVNLLA